MVSYGDVKQWRAAALDEAVGELNKRGDELLGMSDELSASGKPDSWVGSGANEAEQARTRTTDRMEHVVAGVAAARRAVADASDSVTVLERLVRETDDVATANGFSITNEGQIVPQATAGDGGFFDQISVMADLANRVSTILERANDVDVFLSGVLDKISGGQITDGGATSLADASAQGEKQGSLHEELLKKYNVSIDPGGIVSYPDGALGWVLEKFGIEPMNMTAGEAALLDDIGLAGTKDAYDIYKTAVHDAENVFDRQGLTDGHSDAFRHAYWNAMLANRFGPEWTEQYTTAHERVGTNSAAAEAMDLHNNEVGRRIAAEHPDASPEELKGLVEQAVRNGEMVVVGPDGQLVRSNEVPMGQTGRAEGPPAEGGQDPKPQDKYEDNTSGGYNPGSDGDNYGTYDN
ncbi:DUF6973 domain-containing protein [Kibdelosporangium aridum]|uniref:DUF6973 domain-containing protein n=1 Tax=Kibdelosporangium aridum TaxID=2030 RepID=A0A1W2FNH6_KIBAR|nr:hypothetical protein [Kibdelosporangium aridum]SMD23433.1 hypothetical protein SAMN05661093_07968 [Kibdelosporangium aridum]